MYQLTGHGESELSDYMEELLAGDNVETETLSLLSMESVPEDASVVMINAPTRPKCWFSMWKTADGCCC